MNVLETKDLNSLLSVHSSFKATLHELLRYTLSCSPNEMPTSKGGSNGTNAEDYRGSHARNGC